MNKAGFTMAEVANHCTEEDCWIVIRGKVYDMTDYILNHPGGKRVLIRSAGKDGTAGFVKARHSGKAIEDLKPLYIGNIKDNGSQMMMLNPFSALEPKRVKRAKIPMKYKVKEES